MVECDGHSGGLALLCKKEDTVSVLGSSSNFINVQVTIEQLGTWQFTGFYGHPGQNRRRESWAMLRQLVVSSALPWCIMGDFNNLLALSKKRGEALKEATSANLLRNQRRKIQMPLLTTTTFEISGFQMPQLTTATLKSFKNRHSRWRLQ